MIFALNNVTSRPVCAKAKLPQRSRPTALTSAGTRLVLVRNASQNGQNSQSTETVSDATSQESASSASSASTTPSGSRLQTPEKEGFVKGQGTAIVTGAISIIFGVAYLALVSLLDVRGGELQPPPPEAFLN